MKKLLEYIIEKAIGIKDFEIKEEKDEKGSIFTIHSPQESIGLIIGKNGSTIKSIRNILKVKATLEKKYVKLSVAENT